MSTVLSARRAVRTGLVLGATAATVALSTPLASAAPLADLSPLEVSPTTVEVGKPVTLSGSGCLLFGEPRPFVVHYPGGPPEGAASGWSDASGSWSTTIRLDATGPYAVGATCDMMEGNEEYDPVLVTVVAAAAPSSHQATAGPTSDDGSGPAVPIALAAAGGVLLLGAGGYLVHRRRSATVRSAG